MCYTLIVNRKGDGNDMTSGYERLKKWRKNHPEKAKEITMKWKENNPEKVKKAKKEYKETHPEETKKDKEKYYNKNKGNDTNKRQPYTTKEIDLILNKDFPDVELAKMLKRSVRAIQIARCKYKTV